MPSSVGSSTGSTELHAAARSGSIERCKEYLSRKEVREADINSRDTVGRTAFYMAAREGHLDVLKLLAEDSRVDKSISTNWNVSPLRAAQICDHVKVAEWLKENA